MLGQAFFNSIRHSLFVGAMQPSAVDTINVLWDQWVESKATSLDQFAYVLATVLNECGPDMKPKSESFAYSAKRMLEVWPHKFKDLADAQTYVGHPEKLANHVYAGIIGNGGEQSGDGYRYSGKGWPQLTGRANYINFGQMLGLDLVGNPDLVLEPAIGAKVLITGMLDGLFTGKKLSDYFTATKQDATQARAIINGDVAANGAKIAGYWKAFRQALNLGDPAVSPAPVPDAPPAAPPVTAHPAPSPIMKAWQEKLIAAGFPLQKFGADGYGGHETQTAIIAFQASRNPPLPQTGQFDEATRTALNPPAAPRVFVPSPLAELAIETALDAIIPPSPVKEFLMFNFGSIVSIIVGLLPGLPDDVNKIRAVTGNLVTDATDHNGIAGLRDSARFARIMADELDKVADTLDPSGAIQPANPIINK